ncbi:AAA ATPase midasin [Elasticomyces elasticus]|nr:AAA ATPase midasin [Elasticomyces elasticus]
MDCSLRNAALLSRIQDLPSELRDILSTADNETYLRTVSTWTLDQTYTDLLHVHLEPLIPDICARWNQHAGLAKILAAFGRILPHAPHYVESAERTIKLFFATQNNHETDTVSVQEALLGAFRLLAFDHWIFSRHIRIAHVRSLLSNSSRAVRYLAIRVLCLLIGAADAAKEHMIAEHLGRDPIYGSWEGRNIDYRFFVLWEEQRTNNIERDLERLRTSFNGHAPMSQQRMFSVDEFHAHTALIGGVLLSRTPKLSGSSSSRDEHLVYTATVTGNLRNVALGLLSQKPLLLTGLAGSGKTLCMRYVAQRLCKLESMVILHLNEQSDAKLLVGMYTTGESPGSFSWRPGVLTTAVEEGRWLFIEDLDRAPNDIISTLLSLMERRELIIPSRGQTIHAAPGFQIFATVRTVMNLNGEESKSWHNLLGARLWQHVHIDLPAVSELGEVILSLHPVLKDFVPQFASVYSRLCGALQDSSNTGQGRTATVRPITARDLLKWCSRMADMLASKSSFTSSDLDNMFLQGVDCFVGSWPLTGACERLISHLAEELHIDPQRKSHLLRNRSVKYKVDKEWIQIGHVSLRRTMRHGLHSSQGGSGRRAFSTNEHTLRLLEKVAVAVHNREPLLLVGETGTGKTASIQHLAEQLGKKLVPFNLSQQSESGDLLGGFKPVSIRTIIMPMKDKFDDLFSMTFSTKKNNRFLEMLGKAMAMSSWTRVCRLWREALTMVEAQQNATNGSPVHNEGAEKAFKKRKIEPSMSSAVLARWDKFAVDLQDFTRQLLSGSNAFAFTFVEGNIIRAVRNGDWILLDEINLAAPDTLEALADLLDPAPSILLTEAGNIQRINAHPDFRVFAAMNPATDVGKKDLPMGIRSRFTELYVESPDRDLKSLQSIVQVYLGNGSMLDASLALDVSTLYQRIQSLAEQNHLVDGAGQKPHFSLRTLTRTLTFARETAPLCSMRRALYEGFHMSFLTFLDRASGHLLQPIIEQYLFGKHANARAELKKPLHKPSDGKAYVRESGHWLRQGPLPVRTQPNYIITAFIQANLDNLVRAASTRRFPVLIQGPTSSGKTSMIEYLAKCSGNRFVRINNHEHTDLQEYLGTYVSGADGRLQFQEGVLVKALREGHWVVLDELNLAPTEVLEALNRLLDDNRELLIPETQEVVRPHEDFMLFATQNPAGLYGGRKMLSRAFRNRFLELHFDDIPVEELHEILHKRTQIAESWCKRIVQVYKELSALRQENRLFEQKSFATLRDLFRWALRKADTVDQLAVNGFMLLAERVRKPEERQAVKDIIERVMSSSGPRVRINETSLYAAEQSFAIRAYNERKNAAGVVWTRAMRRLYTLVSHAIANDEPVLLVGETGCGKTTVCQMLADALDKTLYTVNAHQNTETGDLIGAQRPLRNRANIEASLRADILSLPEIQTNLKERSVSTDELLQLYDQAMRANTMVTANTDIISQIQAKRNQRNALFEWADGSLVQAMKSGQLFLLDEISLADDSVLERLNSVLETQRTLLLAEKGSADAWIVAQQGFQFFATMNPGGDYGKRELSPALRNRFTEIWVPSLSDMDDILQITQAKLNPLAVMYAPALVEFAQWFNMRYNTSASSSISVRDTLSWIHFINECRVHDSMFAIIHGAAMVYIDTLGANPAALLAVNSSNVVEERYACLQELGRLLDTDSSVIYSCPAEISMSDNQVSVGSFSLPITGQSQVDEGFSFLAPTTRLNAMRIFRALQLSKPVLLEGNPGVGKTTLISAVARLVGMPLTRINLSEQTDLMDLFGSDVPVEGAEAGIFAWRDAPFLKAMKKGEWVLLDEMNLASQSVLEGLNACLDHRGEAYISELNHTFRCHPNFRLFAAQNPHHQGGGRKGLPASFVNRFTVVFADSFTPGDLLLICTRCYPQIPKEEIQKLICFVDRLEDEVVQQRRFGQQGAPWEFNLRDTLRWLALVSANHGLLNAGKPSDFLDVVFTQRFRNARDRCLVQDTLSYVLQNTPEERSLFHNLSLSKFQVGMGLLSRDPLLAESPRSPYRFCLKPRLAIVESLILCVNMNWPVVLVGLSGTGKTTLLEHLANVSGASLVTFPMNADIDAMDLVGGYEQYDPLRQSQKVRQRLETYARRRLASRSAPGQNMSTNAGLSKLDYTIDTIASGQSWTAVAAAVTELLDNDVSPEAQSLRAELAALANASDNVNQARFEWTDGVLIEALEQGKWLVLDNANLCSSSVLDRLNSLLEPNGSLNVNEHSTASGEARLVKPHPDFRIFLTMDPRYGELSRAMRNRTVELCLLPTEDWNVEQENTSATSLVLSEASMYRFSLLKSTAGLALESSMSGIITEGVEHLSLCDAPLLRTLYEQINAGLFDMNPDQVSTFEHQIQILGKVDSEDKEYLKIHYRSAMEHTGLPDDFADVQMMHPLINQSLALQSSSHFGVSVSRACLHEMFCDIASMRQAIENAQRSSMTSSKLSRLERAMAHKRIPNASKDGTRGIDVFLTHVMEAVSGFLKSVTAGQTIDKTTITQLGCIQRFWWSLYCQTNASNFDESTFLAYLDIIKSTMSRSEPIPQVILPLVQSIQNELRVFRISSQLSKGLGMVPMWNGLRPQTAPTMRHLEQLIHLEKVANTFDSLVWKIDIPVMECGRLRSSLEQAIGMVRSGADARALIEELGTAISSISDESVESGIDRTPHFRRTFEGLCQYSDLSPTLLSAGDTQKSILELLARRPTTLTATGVRGGNHVGKPEYFSALGAYLGDHREGLDPVALSNDLHIPLFKTIMGIDHVSLQNLDLLEVEVAYLGRNLVNDVVRLCISQLDQLSGVFRSLLVSVLEAHANFGADPEARQWAEAIIAQLHGTVEHADGRTPAPTLPLHHYLQAMAFNISAISGSYLASNVHESSTSQISSSSKMWTSFALDCLNLYIPNREFDPALRPFVERQEFIASKEGLRKKLDILERFGRSYTGQLQSLRTHQVRSEILEMGAEPSVPEIARPEYSQLPQLQGEFSTLLRLITPLSQSGSQPINAGFTADPLLQQNISRIITRLAQYRAYEDITRPAIGFLQCLRIGMVLNGIAEAQFDQSTHAIRQLARSTPLLGAVPAEFFTLEPVQRLTSKDGSAETKLHALSTVAVARALKSGHVLQHMQYDLVANLFHQFYDHWKVQLQAGRSAEAAKSSVYRYRGGEDEQDETADAEFNELFPSEDNDNANRVKSAREPYGVAARLADVHHRIFAQDSGDAFDMVNKFFSDTATRIGSFAANSSLAGSAVAIEATLPLLYKTLAKHAEMLRSAEAMGRTYNMYTDPNIGQARKLVALVKKVQIRFRSIHKVWPEHATIDDVLRTCDEILQGHHTAPVVTFLAKVEKLHGFMYGWQQVASREYSAASLYDAVTDLIVSWRQLELSTWSRLFDLEDERCKEDAKAWWFIAYENVVAVPLELLEGGQKLEVHAGELLKTLEAFFSTTGIGQYQQRLNLLKDFCRHVQTCLTTRPEFQPIYQALHNFTTYFSHFRGPVNEVLTLGRQTLEKDIKNAIQLASWRDRNVDALRQSAKASHRKLFKLVRKYRALLGQPVTQILQGGIPTTTMSSSCSQNAQNPALMDTSQDSAAVERCAAIGTWLERPARFKKLSTTVSIMRSKANLDNRRFDATEELDSFVADLEASMVKLRKATPTTSTKENQDTVKHLKVQKRKLFADTLRELRMMGLRSSLGMDVLSRQDSLSAVLSISPALDRELCGNGIDAGHAFDQFLDAMMAARQKTRDHSADLTGAEVTRSITYLEDLLAIVINQRAVVQSATSASLNMRDITIMASHVWGDGNVHKSLDHPSPHYPLEDMLACLPAICMLGAKIVNSQAQLAELEVSSVEDSLRSWATRLQALCGELRSVPSIPCGLTSLTHQNVRSKCQSAVEDCHRNILQWIDQYPLLRPTLKQVLIWTTSAGSEAEPAPVANGRSTFSTDVESWTTRVFELLDTILGSMQDLGDALTTLPQSKDDRAWLVREHQVLANAMSSARAEQIWDKFKQLLDEIHNLDSPSTAAALVTTLLPIVQEYAAITAQCAGRLVSLHVATCKMSYKLAKAFTEIASRGFCSPSEKQGGQEEQGDQLESGTGLGEGEGAEDISKDVQDDEDLSELAQDPGRKTDNYEIEDEKDAVDMADADMQGEMGDVPQDGEDDEAGSEKGDEDREDMDEEAGDVDDLGPSTVDEKMWDGGGEAEKDKEGDQGNGEANEDEMAAAKDQQKSKIDDESKHEAGGDEIEEEPGAEESEAVGGEEIDKTDAHMQEGENLELPDDIDMDGNRSDEDKGSDLDDLDDEDAIEELGDDETGVESQPVASPDRIENADEDMSVEDTGEEQAQETAREAGEDADQEDAAVEDQELLQDRHDQEAMNADDVAQSDAQAVGGDIEQQANTHDQANAGAAEQNEGQEGEASEEQRAAGKSGKRSKLEQGQASSGNDKDSEEPAESLPFKKLGDALDKWYRQQEQIRDAQKQDDAARNQAQDSDVAGAEFEHLHDEQASADAQALGGATEEQAKALDESMGVSADKEENPQDFLEEDASPEAGEESSQSKEAEIQDVDQAPGQTKAELQREQNVFVGRRHDQPLEDVEHSTDRPEDEFDMEEVDTQLTNTHLEPDSASTRLTQEEGLALWTTYESRTRILSHLLTEHLRLILSPTQATKMRGDFRTGKRLNIKRIIPYVASQYKRDKIWMRRSVPSKRAYQIMLAIDDSKSMAEGGASALAFETLALVARSLEMLEAGELCIVGFGEDVEVKHEFGSPFTSQAGAEVVRRFAFEQTKTNVRKLVADAIELFRSARTRTSGSSAELWQLQLIISDGMCEDHAAIRRLVRQAQEERIMIVFIIVDAAYTSTTTGASVSGAAATSGGGGGITNLKNYTFERDPSTGETVMKDMRYLDTFPFGYYLIVRDVAELPGVLAGALRQWFAEVVDTGGY